MNLFTHDILFTFTHLSAGQSLLLIADEFVLNLTLCKFYVNKCMCNILYEIVKNIVNLKNKISEPD